MLTDHLRFNRIISHNQVFNREYLEKAVDACAAYLDAGIRSNSSIVYLCAPNHLKTIIAFLGILKTGHTCLLVDPNTVALEFEEMLADSPPSAIVRIDSSSIDFDYGKEISFVDSHMDASLASQLDDVGIMIYTAAEDGHAKAAMLTHTNLLSSARVIAADNCVGEASVSCALLPFDHIFGFQYGVITPLVGNGTIVIADISEIQKIGRIAEELRNHAVTNIYSVPLLYYLLSKSPHISEIGRQVYSMICGGYLLPGSLRERLAKNWGITIYEGYGLTETAAGCIWQRRGENYKVDSFGLPVRNCRVMIQDDDGLEMPRGEKGEICINGAHVAKGYFNHPETTRQSIVDGWLHTGDYGKMDDDGNTCFMGLKKRMFNVAGKKAYPEEIRRLMMKHVNVKSVDLRSDYDALTGDRIKAKIVLKNHTPDSESEFSRWCTKAIGPHKIPQKILFEEE